jgi:hypothetical protein
LYIIITLQILKEEKKIKHEGCCDNALVTRKRIGQTNNKLMEGYKNGGNREKMGPLSSTFLMESLA